MNGTGDKDWRELDTTPEFREFVGKKLDELVACMIKEKDRSKHLHLRDAAVEGGVHLLSGAPLLEVSEEPTSEPPVKRPKLAGVDLQKYQLKKKSRRGEKGEARDRDARDGTVTSAAPVDRDETTGPSVITPTDGPKADSDSDSSDDDDLARFAEAAVPQNFMASLSSSKTVKLDKL